MLVIILLRNSYFENILKNIYWDNIFYFLKFIFYIITEKKYKNIKNY
jgi:hypothetical protein